MEETEISKTSVAEFLSVQFIKFAANPNPIASFIGAFCDGLNTMQMNNIVEILKELNTRIKYIEDKTQVKLRFDTPIFSDDILPILQKAKDEFNSQKRQLYATFIAACIHPDNLNCSNKVIFSNYLDRLDYLSIYVLNSIKPYCTEKSLVEKIGSKDNQDTILVHLWNLKSFGLVETISAEEYEKLHRPSGNRLRHSNVSLYKRSQLGDEFLNFIIKGIPDNN